MRGPWIKRMLIHTLLPAKRGGAPGLPAHVRVAPASYLDAHLDAHCAYAAALANAPLAVNARATPHDLSPF